MVQKEFGCDNNGCNHTIVVTSPDDVYTRLLRDVCCDESMEKKYECDDCHFMNTRYWCVKHPSHVIGFGAKDPYDETRFSTYV
ncbi:hypothetical protein NZNM25_10590 [Nitrosopumilus zosterae]|uniref:Uncharacterized protein n=1 Tax=Nitrosopumilus zosterae TaxID=718286 RepID=A0A2S2KS39_9ARCH|nr:hypothetical protein [Nitrosopumilus zosterae]BDQ30296.1 hypothetical protein NZOSNM25_000397 [Nitrosopumilus zosterae]GBH34268.1 hypothetical protein NZNM25_10590 [Nitrosopumilus zosterae]